MRMPTNHWITWNLGVAFVSVAMAGDAPNSQKAPRYPDHANVMVYVDASGKEQPVKTGLLGAETGKPSLGWVVGWAEKGSSVTVFAMNMDCKTPEHIPARLAITQTLLGKIGAI